MSTSFGGTADTGDDFIDSFQLPVRFAGPYVEHSRRITDVSRGLRNVVSVEKWSRGRELGRGGFGTVYLETEGNGGVRAVKEVPKQTGRTKTMDHLREVLAMVHFSKEEAFFVTLQGWYQNSSHIYIAMEYFPNGDLCNCVLTALPESEVQIISHQLIEALQFMHQRKFTHRDLKPSNIFVVSKAPRWWVKLGDFGVSKRVMNDSTSMHTSIETDYTAPEITGHLMSVDESSSYTSAVDMWSLGCLVHWLLTGELPLSRRNLMSYCMQRISFPLDHLKAHQSSEPACDFICKLLQPLPRDRLSAAGALEHGWPQAFVSELTMEDNLRSPVDNGVGNSSNFDFDRDLPKSPMQAFYENSQLKRGIATNIDGVETNIDGVFSYKGQKFKRTISEMSHFLLKGREIHPVVLENKIKQMLGNDATFTQTTHLDVRAYNYWAQREFTENQIQDLKSLSRDHEQFVESLESSQVRKYSSIAKLPSNMPRYFIDGQGLEPEVLFRELPRFLGPDAIAKPSIFRDVNGFVIICRRMPTSEMLDELKRLSENYRQEKGAAYQSRLSKDIM